MSDMKPHRCFEGSAGAAHTPQVTLMTLASASCLKRWKNSVTPPRILINFKSFLYLLSHLQQFKTLKSLLLAALPNNLLTFLAPTHI